MNATMNIGVCDNLPGEPPGPIEPGPIEQREITGTNHAGRVVAALTPADDPPPPLYSDLYFTPPPSYYEAVGRGVEFAEIPASQPSSIEQQQDIESAESPSSRALAQRRVEASHSCHYRLRNILTGVPPCMVFLLLAIVAIAILMRYGGSTH